MSNGLDVALQQLRALPSEPIGRKVDSLGQQAYQAIDSAVIALKDAAAHMESAKSERKTRAGAIKAIKRYESDAAALLKLRSKVKVAPGFFLKDPKKINAWLAKVDTTLNEAAEHLSKVSASTGLATMAQERVRRFHSNFDSVIQGRGPFSPHEATLRELQACAYNRLKVLQSLKGGGASIATIDKIRSQVIGVERMLSQAQAQNISGFGAPGALMVTQAAKALADVDATLNHLYVIPANKQSWFDEREKVWTDGARDLQGARDNVLPQVPLGSVEYAKMETILSEAQRKFDQLQKEYSANPTVVEREKLLLAADKLVSETRRKLQTSFEKAAKELPTLIKKQEKALKAILATVTTAIEKQVNLYLAYHSEEPISYADKRKADADKRLLKKFQQDIDFNGHYEARAAAKRTINELSAKLDSLQQDFLQMDQSSPADKLAYSNALELSLERLKVAQRQLTTFEQEWHSLQKTLKKIRKSDTY